MKQNEFNRKISAEVAYDALVCPYASYAIMHLYLQDFDDKRILAFCNQGIQLLKKEKEIFENNLFAVVNYQPTTKDLKLIWEVSEKSVGAINFFSNYEKYGSSDTIYGSADGIAYSLYILTIKAENIKSFQGDLAAFVSKKAQ
jgi:hypothetical protein